MAAQPYFWAGVQEVRAQVRKRLVNALDLTADQKQQAKTIMQGARQTAQPLAQQLKQDREALAEAIQAGDSAKIQQLSTEMGSVRGRVLAIRSDAIPRFYATLTPDQKAKAAEFLQRARQVLGKQAGRESLAMASVAGSKLYFASADLTQSANRARPVFEQAST